MTESKLVEPFEDLDTCDVQKCKSVKRLKQILHFMQFLEDNKNKEDVEESLVEYTEKNQYSNIINDYHHILTKHLNTKESLQNDKNYQIINKEMTQLIQCNIEQCNLYQRNGRNREQKTKDADKKDKDTKGSILVDILDNIHTHFIHSYDTGYRLKPNASELLNQQPDSNDNDATDLDANALHVDATLTSLRNTLHEKRKRLENIRGKDRVQNNKFMTDFNEPQQNDNESDDDDTKNDKEEYANTASDFSFGTKLYYWAYYKNNEDEDRIFHPGDIFSNWYIEPTYSSLKEEILAATDINVFADTLEKAQYILANSHTVKAMKCRNGLYDTELSTRYAIAVDTPLTCLHLMSVIFYTDFSKLSYTFSLSFRKKSAKEAVEALKKRNAKFWHWAKLLNETVSLFGNRLNFRAEPHISTLYHGVTYMYFDSFVTRFISPTSTTLSLSVATIFAEDGIILAVEHKGGMEEMFPYYFNCSLVSCFANENERLFIGGNGDAEYFREGLLEFKSIFLMNEQVNLQPFIRALSLFSIVINGQGHIDKKKYAKPVKYYYKIICLLIKDMKSPNSTKCPPYIRTCFKKLLDSRKYVKVNLFGMNKYSEFSQMLLSSDVPTLVEVEYICKLFLNCNKIVCYMNYCPVSKFLINHLIKALKQIGSNQTIKLREIVLEAYMFYPKFGLHKCQSLFKKELKDKWEVNHLELFTGVGCWTGDCNGLQIIYNESHQMDDNEPVNENTESANKTDGNNDPFAIAAPPKARNKRKTKTSDK